MDELGQRLSEGDHPVATQRYKSAEELKQAIDRGYVLVKFTTKYTKGHHVSFFLCVPLCPLW